MGVRGRGYVHVAPEQFDVQRDDHRSDPVDNEHLRKLRSAVVERRRRRVDGPLQEPARRNARGAKLQTVGQTGMFMQDQSNK